MTGVVMGAAGVGGATGGYSGTPGSIVWGNIFAFDGGSNNSETLSGITGAMLVTAAKTGAGQLFYTLNGVETYYAGAFRWPEGQTLSWGITTGGSNVSGTVTVTNATAGTTLSTFTYSVRNSNTGNL